MDRASQDRARGYTDYYPNMDDMEWDLTKQPKFEWEGKFLGLYKFKMVIDSVSAKDFEMRVTCMENFVENISLQVSIQCCDTRFTSHTEVSCLS